MIKKATVLMCLMAAAPMTVNAQSTTKTTNKQKTTTVQKIVKETNTLPIDPIVAGKKTSMSQQLAQTLANRKKAIAEKIKQIHKESEPEKPKEVKPKETQPKEETKPAETRQPEVQPEPAKAEPVQTEPAPMEQTQPEPVQQEVQAQPVQEAPQGELAFGGNGLLIEQPSAAAQQVINGLLGIPGHRNGQYYHQNGLDAQINNLSVPEAVYVIHRIEGAGFGQTGDGYAGYDTPQSHRTFVNNQVNRRFGGSIHALLRAWGTYSYGGY